MTVSQNDHVFLEIARLGARNDLLVELDEKTQFPRLRRLYRSYTRVDLAHAVMLVETGILSRSRGVELLKGLLRIHEMSVDEFPWLDNSNSYLVHVEHWLGQQVGEDIAGFLQTGRSRNDQDAAAERLFERELILALADALSKLLSRILDQAESHAETLMPGYTHLQHAQPWTFGHYLLRHASILTRDLDRLRDVYPRVNLSALGGAANAGTSWPIDRRRTAELLGHNGIVMNSCDAGEFTRDHVEEVTAALAILTANLGRFATDLYLWSSFEFGYVEIDDSLSGTSSIMPQKKNPHALERVKAVGGQAAGWLATVMACQRPVFSTDLDFTFADDVMGRFGELTMGSIRLMDEVVRTITVHKARMAANSDAYWSTTSHLADELVRQYDISFRSAHNIVAVFVRQALVQQQTPQSVKAELLTSAGREVAGIEIAIDDAALRLLLNGENFIRTRVSEGSVSPHEVRRHISALREDLSSALSIWKNWRAASEHSVVDLLGKAEELAGTVPRQPS